MNQPLNGVAEIPQTHVWNVWSWISLAIELVGPWNFRISVSYIPNYKPAISDKITCWEGEQFPLTFSRTNWVHYGISLMHQYTHWLTLVTKLLVVGCNLQVANRTYKPKGLWWTSGKVNNRYAANKYMNDELSQLFSNILFTIPIYIQSGMSLSGQKAY